MLFNLKSVPLSAAVGVGLSIYGDVSQQQKSQPVSTSWSSVPRVDLMSRRGSTTAAAASGRSAAASRQQASQPPSFPAVVNDAGEIMPANSAGAAAQGGSNYLVALAGMKVLESHVQDPKRGRKWKDRVSSWEERAGLQNNSVKLALGFLDVLGVSRASVYKRLLENALSGLLDKIPHLTEERMLLLLNDSFRYATQPELKSVPLKIITSMSTVPDKVLHKIIELQTHQPAQFEELGLPMAIKRLAWEKDSALFVKVITPLAERYIASEFSPKMILASQQVRVYRSLDTIKRRKLMGPQRINALAECTGGRPILIGYLCDEIADRYAQEASQAKAGLWATLLTDVLVTARERAYGSIPDQSVDRLCALASRLDLAVKEDVFGDLAVRDVQRLFREATGIGEDQHERAKAARRASAIDKARMEDDTTKLRKVLKSAWSAVTKMDTRNWFKEPVTEAIAPGYHKLINTPMDLGTMLKKIRGGGYPSFSDFDRDLRLMWENCRLYNNDKESPFYVEAQRLENEWSKIAPSFEDELREQEGLPPPSSSASVAGTNSKRKGSSVSTATTSAGQSAEDTRSSGGGGPPLAPMASATQLERDGLGRRVGLAAILLSEPFAAKLMYRHASAGATEACRAREMLPRDHPTFAPLLQLLELGDAARAMFQAGSFGVRAVEEALTRSVLPCVVALHARAHDILVTVRRAGSGSGSSSGAQSKDSSGSGQNTQERKEQEEKEKQKKEAGLALLDGEEGVRQDWRKWYREFPAVRRMTCTMLCRALVHRAGADIASDAAVLLMPAARAAVKRMTDERWFWATLAEVLQKSKASSAGGTAAGKGAGMPAAATGGRLKPEIATGILELFSRGLDSACTSDAIFQQALEVVEGLLPPRPPQASSTSKNVVVLTPNRALLEELVDKAVAAASKIFVALEDSKRKNGKSDALPVERQRVKAMLDRIFTKAPPTWKKKLAAIENDAGVGGSSKKTPSISIRLPKRKQPEGAESTSAGATKATKKRARK